MTRGINALKTRTELNNAAVVYDSSVDPFTGQELFDTVSGKAHVGVVGFTEDGDVSGGCSTVPVKGREKRFNDTNVFIVTFESRGRCVSMKRFAVQGGKKHEAPS